jgi:hypothetical protein
LLFEVFYSGGEERKMAKFMTAIIGVIAGFVLAHLINQSPEGRRVFARVRSTVESFLSGLRDAYRA